MTTPLHRKRSFSSENENMDELASHSAKRPRSRSASFSEETTQIDDDQLQRPRPPPSVNDLDRLRYHIHLSDLGSTLQKAANAIFPGNQTSRYSKVDVILLSWEDEDPNLPVSVEINELASVFTDLYGYEVEQWLIPSDNSHNRLQTKILEFLGSGEPEHLKIVYYAGHGKLTNHGQPAWTSRRNSRKDRCPTVKWSGIQNTLEESRSDVLILLDCCASGVCTTDEGNGVTELIAACAYNAIANGVGPFSFTHALIAKLRLLAQVPYFTIGYLYNTLFTEVQGWRIEDSRHKKAPVHLVLSQNSDLPRSIRLSATSKKTETPEDGAPTTEPSKITPSTSQNTAQMSVFPTGHISSSEDSDAKDSSLFSPATSPHSSMTSMLQLPEYPRLLFSIRIDEDVKPGELSTELFTDWLREVPVVASMVRIEAGFASDSTLLMVSMPAAMSAYLSSNPAITLLGSTRSKNLLSLPAIKSQAGAESLANQEPIPQSKDELSRPFGTTGLRTSASALQNQRVAAIIQATGHSVSPQQQFYAASAPSSSTALRNQRPKVPLFTQSAPGISPFLKSSSQDFQVDKAPENLQEEFVLFDEHVDWTTTAWSASENGFTDSAIGSTEFTQFDSSDMANFESFASPFTPLDSYLTGDQWYPLFPDEMTTEQSPNKEASSSSDANNPLSKHLQSSTQKVTATSSEVHSWLSTVKSLRAEIDMPPIVVKDPNDSVAIKRARNTIAARKSRERKMKRFDELEEQICKLEAEREHWRELALKRKETIKNDNVSLQVVAAPHPYTIKGKSVFLSGGIEQVRAPWQMSIAKSLSHLPITILNPLRPDWDSSWKENISDPKFLEQVNWELDALEKVDVIAIYFPPENKAPIALLELGLSARSGKVIVACPEGFWKRGNVQMICQRFNIELVDTVEELSKAVEKRLAPKLEGAFTLWRQQRMNIDHSSIRDTTEVLGESTKEAPLTDMDQFNEFTLFESSQTELSSTDNKDHFRIKAQQNVQSPRPEQPWTSLPADVTDQVDLAKSELLNADGKFGGKEVLFRRSKPSESQDSPQWVQSDNVGPLMIVISFQSTMKIHSLEITSLLPTKPGSIGQLPIWRPMAINLHTYSHESAEANDMACTETLFLSGKNWDVLTDKAVIPLDFARFQNVSNLILFVRGANDSCVRIDEIKIFGERGAPRSMRPLKKIGDAEVAGA